MTEGILGTKMLFGVVRTFLIEDLAGKKDRAVADATYEKLFELIDLALPHVTELEHKTLRGDEFGDKLAGLRTEIFDYAADSYRWSNRAKEVHQLVEKLNQARPDKEFTKTAETFLRSVISLAINREEYLKSANQNADAFFVALNEYVDAVNNGENKLPKEEWQRISDLSIDTMNRAIQHTKEIGAPLEQGDYRNGLLALNKSMIAKGNEVAKKMPLHSKHLKKDVAPQADNQGGKAETASPPQTPK